MCMENIFEIHPEKSCARAVLPQALMIATRTVVCFYRSMEDVHSDSQRFGSFYFGSFYFCIPFLCEMDVFCMF